MNIFYTGFRACIENDMKSQKLSMNQIVVFSIILAPYVHVHDLYMVCSERRL